MLPVPTGSCKGQLQETAGFFEGDDTVQGCCCFVFTGGEAEEHKSSRSKCSSTSTTPTTTTSSSSTKEKANGRVSLYKGKPQHLLHLVILQEQQQ